MSKIQVMDMKLANMIAAGEVIERPASVIKELVENALDAQATVIKIEVNQVGLESIIVTDNGTGMDKDDCHQAFLRHATSKLKIKEDLYQIKSLGFRGEALPSIASVAKVKLESRMKNSEGYFVYYVQNECIDQGLSSLNIGTKVTVSELFYNTPARFKYLKSEHAEKQAILDIFDKLALSRPDVYFVLVIDGREIKKTSGNGIVAALIESIYGKGYADGLKTIEKNIGKILIKVYLVSPHFSRSRKKDVHIFVNGRAVRNYALSQAVVEGYASFLMTNRYPIACLYLEIDPSLVDANVHPQKMEVKLSNEQFIAFQLAPLVKQGLEDTPIPIRETLKEIKKKATHIPSLFDQVAVLPSEISELKIEESPSETIQESKEKIPEMDYIGTFSGTYLLFQNQSGLFLMDQHAAAERIRYEYYQHQVGKLTQDKYDLLVPRPVAFTMNDWDIVKENYEKFNQIGFTFINDQLITHPIWLRDDEIDIALSSMVDMLSQSQQIDLRKLRDQLAKDISCKGAIKANHQLSQAEIKQIINDLKSCDNPYTCPHGRPVLIKLTHYEIERMFKRIV